MNSNKAFKYLVHFVDCNRKLSDSERANQEAMLSGLPPSLKSSFKLASAGIYN